jgi:hypothetical protein
MARPQLEVNRFTGKEESVLRDIQLGRVDLVESELNHLFESSHWNPEMSAITGCVSDRRIQNESAARRTQSNTDSSSVKYDNKLKKSLPCSCRSLAWST